VDEEPDLEDPEPPDDLDADPPYEPLDVIPY